MCVRVFVCISVSVCVWECSIEVSICSSCRLQVFWDWVVWINGGKFTAQRLLSVPAIDSKRSQHALHCHGFLLQSTEQELNCWTFYFYVYYMPIICIGCIFIFIFTAATYFAASCCTRSSCLRVKFLVCVHMLGKKDFSDFWLLSIYDNERFYWSYFMYIYLHMQWKYWITLFFHVNVLWVCKAREHGKIYFSSGLCLTKRNSGINVPAGGLLWTNVDWKVD